MAKTKPRVLREPVERVLGQTHEELLRELGIEGLTRKECLQGLLGDLTDGSAPYGEALTVTQISPRRR